LYSCAYFPSRDAGLEEASIAKLERLCGMLRLEPGLQVLEIGSGWGACAMHMARKYGCKVVSVTISERQHAEASRRVKAAGLEDRVEIRMQDYRDIGGQFDRLISIEMIEAVGERYWSHYFRALRDRLRPGGNAALQAITIADNLFPKYRVRADFVQKHIFPGGMLPNSAALRDPAEAAGLKQIGWDSFADSYSRTLRAWRRQFNSRWDRIAELGFDRGFYRMWNFYLASSAAGFAAGTTDVVQVHYRRPS